MSRISSSSSSSSSSPLEVIRVTACVFVVVSLLLVSRASAVDPISLLYQEKFYGKNFLPQRVGDGSNEVKNFNVVSFGAKGDGNNPDTTAFLQAWQAACNTMGSTRVIVPKGKTFLVEPTFFNGGHCRADSIDVQIRGKIVAPGSISAWDGRSPDHWLAFYEPSRLTITGGGIIDGQGSVWWKCKEEKRCDTAPAALYVSKGEDVSISNLNFVDSQGVHVKVVFSKNVQISNLHLTAPEDSPNTDGINVGTCENVQISSSDIQTGDDCISIIGTTQGMNITDISCGPGHGISIGSLGENGATDSVQDVHVKNAHFFRTQNGVRIKTWQGGRGIVKNVLFEQLNFTQARNPIVIDQFYCPGGGCPDKAGAVKIEDVRVVGAKGTASGEIAINLKCKSHMCSAIYFRDIELRSSDPAMKAISFCSDSDGISEANVQPPVPCLQSRSPTKRHPQNVTGWGRRSSSSSHHELPWELLS